MKISVVINTYNNEKTLKECLESVKDFDEIVICDMYSTDKTIEIAKQYNAKIFNHEKIKYVEPARNFAISKAENEWILIVDSDEIITEELKKYLYEFTKNPKDFSAIKIPRLNYYLGKPLEILYPDKIIRFIKKGNVYWPPEIHATPTLEKGNLFVIDSQERQLAIIHLYTSGLKDLLTTLNTYTDIELEHKIEKDEPLANPFIELWKAFWIILEKLVMKNGYKDGLRGVVISILFGLYKFSIYVKYWEYKKSLSLKYNESIDAKELFSFLKYKILYISTQNVVNHYGHLLKELKLICDFALDKHHFIAITEKESA